jgi:hypothetical protein
MEKKTTQTNFDWLMPTLLQTTQKNQPDPNKIGNERLQKEDSAKDLGSSDPNFLISLLYPAYNLSAPSTKQQ